MALIERHLDLLVDTASVKKFPRCRYPKKAVIARFSHAAGDSYIVLLSASVISGGVPKLDGN